MPRTYELKSCISIGDSDAEQVAVADVTRAAAWYADTLGFTVVERGDSPAPWARVTRDDVTLRLAENGLDPEQISFYIGVEDVERLRAEWADHGAQPSEVEPMEHDGAPYRVFWLKDEDGICYCVGRRGDEG